MKINIIGAGVVGLATGKGFARFGHKVVYSDIDPKAQTRVGDAEFRVLAKSSIIPEADVHFVCVPEDAAPDVVRWLNAARGAIVIRSSVPPGTTAKLSEELGRVLWHNPEFLREATSEQDILWAKHTIIGAAAEEKAKPYGLEEAYREMNIEVLYCSSTESELVKLFTNNYLAMLISYWNQAKTFCDALGVNSHKVAKLVALDPRVSSYGAYMHGAPYGGTCLPKDILQMIKLADKLGVFSGFLFAVRTENLRLGGS